jgi:hypothetical protein
MQKASLSINLQQFKLKVAKITQTKTIPFRDGIPKDSWWCHPNLSIRQTKGLEVFKAKD